MQGMGTSMTLDPQKSYAGDGRDFNFEGAGQNEIRVSASYEPFMTIDGTIFYPGGGGLTFSLDHSADYESAAALADIAGTYSGQGRPANAVTGELEEVTLRMTTSGTISGITQSTECSFAGTVTPRARGNVFDITVQFNGVNCADSLATVSGVAFANGAPGTVVALALNPGRTDGFLFTGTRTAP